MDIKKNDYIVVRRHANCFEDIDVEEFTETVRGHRNGGYQLRGELQIVVGVNETVIAQVLVAPDPTPEILDTKTVYMKGGVIQDA